jgi:hypothetical protein
MYFDPSSVDFVGCVWRASRSLANSAKHFGIRRHESLFRGDIGFTEQEWNSHLGMDPRREFEPLFSAGAILSAWRICAG